MDIGVLGETACAVDGRTLAAQAACGKEFQFLASPLKGAEVKRIAVVSGGGGADGLEAAIAAGADMLVTGEFGHTMYHIVQENPIHVAVLGHYNSEVHGVQSLQKLAEKELNIPTVFLDLPTGY